MGFLVAGGAMPMPGGPAADIAMGGVGPPWLPLLVLVPGAAAYAVGVVRLARRGDRWPVNRSVAAAGGGVVLTAALLPPLMTSMSFPVQVMQHLLLAMLAPLLLALSAPITLALRSLPAPGRRRLLTVLHSRAVRVLNTAPVVLVLDVGGMYVYYLSPLYSASHAHPWLHVVVHTHMFLAGCLLSWYLIGRDPMPRRPSTGTAVVVLIVAGGAHDVLAKLMYAHLLPHGGGAPGQLEAGAQLMFYGGDGIEIAFAALIMLAWYVRGGRQLAHDRRRSATSRPAPGLAPGPESAPGQASAMQTAQNR